MKDNKTENTVQPDLLATSEPGILSMEAVEDGEEPQKPEKPSNKYSIWSFILTLIPILLYAQAVLAEYHSTSMYGGLAYIFVIIYYCSTLGIYIEIEAISLGIKGLKNGLPNLARLSLFLKACYLVWLFARLFL